MVFPHGDAHILCNGSPPCIVDYGKHLKELFSQGVVLARYGGGGETTVFHCGYLVCDLELCKTFLGGLPPVFANLEPPRHGSGCGQDWNKGRCA